LLCQFFVEGGEAMPDSNLDVEILKFDVACALGVLGKDEMFPFELPEKLALPPAAEALLTACIEPESFTKYGCTIRADPPTTSAFELAMGHDSLRLHPGGRILAGGSGVTIQLHDKDLSRSYALKAARMSVLAYDRPTLTLDDRIGERFTNEFRAFENERQLARRLSHENIAQHLFGSIKKVRQEAGELYYAYSVSEWIEGASSLSDHLTDRDLSAFELVNLIRQSFRALHYIHSRRILHWDLKSDNILISSDGTLKIIDFGNAKYLDDLRDPRDLLVTTTEGKYPSASGFEPEENDAQGSRRFQIHLPHISWNDPYLDLWMLGQEWNRCLDLSPRFLDDPAAALLNVRNRYKAKSYGEVARESHSVFECLEVIFDRLLHSLTSPYVDQIRARGVEFDPSHIYYRNAGELLRELDRIEPLLGAGQNIPELLVSLGDIVRLPVTGNSIFTGRVSKLTDSIVAAPTKLHLQLAQVREVYPGATHTRFEHLLGTVTTASHIVRSLYLNEMNAFWRVSASEDDIRAVLLGALLHDVGHIAYGHFIEEMSDLMAGAGHVDYIRAVLLECQRYAEAMEAGTEKDFRTDSDPFRIEVSEISELCSILQGHWCDDEGRAPGSYAGLTKLLARVRVILGGPTAESQINVLTRIGTRQALDSIMRSVVDGPLDADKLDYLRRDSHHSGVMFANGIDVERFFESLRVCMPTAQDGSISTAAIGVSDKGIAAVETIITSRYHLFFIVYWHRTVRCVTAMLQRVLVEIFLHLQDNEWFEFRRDLLLQFRRNDDREALHWLESQLSKYEVGNQSIGSEILLEGESPGGHRAIMGDLMDALLGDRDKYFEMAFELNYSGFVASETYRGQTASGRLHDAISAAFHNTKAGEGNKDRRSERRRQLELRRTLEQKFSNEIKGLVIDTKTEDQSFRIDTILLDVPESSKDQIAGLHVDKRSKRSRRSSSIQVPGRKSGSDFEDVRSVSPIAAALSDVFRRWGRRIRIFMTQRDLERLEAIGLRAGDVSALWEKVLYAHFQLSPVDQLSMHDM
jgi:HD superfamily phosphohydrolase